jgi:hypothetical protein
MARSAVGKARFLLDPVEFQKHQLCRTLWQKQKDILRSVYDNPLTAVKGCHASGKTFAAAGLPLSWLVRFKTGRVFDTAPTQRQVKSFWKDVAVARLGGPVRQLLPAPTSMGLEVGPDRYAFGASSSAGVNIQGLHGSDVLIIADEAPGIETDIWDAIEGIRAGGNVRVLELGIRCFTNTTSGHYRIPAPSGCACVRQLRGGCGKAKDETILIIKLCNRRFAVFLEQQIKLLQKLFQVKTPGHSAIRRAQGRTGLTHGPGRGDPFIYRPNHLWALECC